MLSKNFLQDMPNFNNNNNNNNFSPKGFVLSFAVGD